ncbi:protoporphyrinogen oxidase HemJ [Rhizobium halophytocola]|uniref:Protoporphyrinogen IX oxidase n=1 Tax=Rhizobium halophytocola TaxID=735519 RepID=A0ABS4E1P7_9HYPH|nr:protoporphyrinogen oxidase HemJ [Rhizobium halophytocola]MBP1851852.1 putative membrane protein [Rhizobium halophytocola]
MAEGKAPGSKAGLRAAIALAVFLLIVAGLVFADESSRYLWVKSLHLIAVISWMAGMFYLPRLFLYHLDSKPDSDQARTFAIMERRLYRIIMNPAMTVAWICGLYLAWEGFGFSGGWLHLKILLALGMTATHIYFGRAVGAFEKGLYIGTGRFWRIANEVPTILMIVIVVLVVVKPF